MEESSAEEMPDIEIPPVEVEMKIGDELIIPPAEDDDNTAAFNDYKKEMLENGLVSSDLEYLCTAYKKLEDVKFIKIHCTSCDKHIGSAPNDLQNRYEHPLLKVLICGDCFQFYSSGDFEKDEDGSELYCRWCGEGGQVFCCTKCPFVFCKKCIRRNLGRQAAKLIENSDNWMCFSCDPIQISRHRATYWAIQKYSEEMIQKAKVTDDTSILSIDDNICCNNKRRSSDVYNKLVQPPKKRQRMSTTPTLQQYTPMLPKNKKTNKIKVWQPPSFAQQPEDEVICTPDILPLDESPPHSPERATPPPMIPLMQQAMPPIPVPRAVRPPKVPPLIIRPPVQRSMNIADLQKHLQQNYTQLVLTPRPKLTGKPINNQSPAMLIRKSMPILQKNTPQNNGNYKLLINSTPTTSNIMNSKFVLGPVNKIQIPSTNTNINKPTPVSSTLTPVSSTLSPVSNQSPVANNQISTLKVNTTNNVNLDWFDKALLDCAEITEYISTKISSLSGVHTRAYKSEKLMTELHNTFQTYMQVANEKINTIRRVMQQNYANDMEKHFVQNKKMVNPFARKPRKKSKKVSDVSSYSEDSNSKDSDYKDSDYKDSDYKDSDKEDNSRDSKESHSRDSKDSAKSTNKTKFVLTRNIQPEEVLFDMDVTNASDEDSRSANDKNEEKVDDDSDDDVQEIIDKSRLEVIQIDDSDDEEHKNKEHKDEEPKEEQKNEELVDKEHKDEEIKDTEHKDEELKDKDAAHKDDEGKEEELKEAQKNDELNNEEHKEKENNDELKEKELTDEERMEEEHNNEEVHTDEEKEETFTVSNDVLERIKSKHHIHNMSSKELLKYLTAVVIATPKTNPETEELSDLKKLLEMVELQRHIEIKLKNKIRELSAEPTTEESDPTNKENSKINKNETSTDQEEESKMDISDVEKELLNLADEEGAKNVSNPEDSPNNPEESDKESSSAEKANEDSEVDEPYDIEDILGSNILVKPSSHTSFGDAFSKFVCTNVPDNNDLDLPENNMSEVNDPDLPEANDLDLPEANDLDLPEAINPDLPDPNDISINIARELDIIPEYVNDICNRDNGSLSLPPDSITSITANDMELLNKELKSDNKSDSEIMLNSEILALQQLAENCVNNVDEHKNTTECKG